MSFLNKFKIKPRLIILFGVGMITLAMLSVYAFHALEQSSGIVIKIHRHPLAVSNAALAASESVVKMHRAMKDVAMSTNDVQRQRYREVCEQEEKIVMRNLDLVKERILGEEGERMEQETRKLFLDWRTIRQSVHKKLSENDPDGARKITREKGAAHVRLLEESFAKLKAYAINKANGFIENSKEQQRTTMNYLNGIIAISGVIFVVLGLVSGKSISDPIVRIKSQISEMAKGAHPEDIHFNGSDEVAEMNQEMQKLVGALRRTSEFAREIGDGNFEAEFESLGKQDILGESLIQMNLQLKEAKDKEELEKWIMNGVQKAGEILQEDLGLENMCAQLSEFLAMYVNAQQIAFYTIHDFEASEEIAMYLMTAGYAVESDHFKSYKFGDGIIGQVARSKKSYKASNITADQSNISSALVKLSPKNLYVFPLHINDKTYGVIEVLSENPLSEKQRRLFYELSYKMANTIIRIQSSQQTELLLEETKEKTEELLAQEEELKQNIEEMNAIQEKMNQNNSLLITQNAKVSDSINYAKGIQQAIIPHDQLIRTKLPKTFVYYKPKDIVSGDFPWYFDGGKHVYVAAVDCTGHGVPGAMMSMIGCLLLNELAQNHSYTTGQMLDELHNGLVRLLKQDNEKSFNINDGMDVALCKIDPEKRTVEFSGAYRNLIIARNGKRLEDQKGNKFPIGGTKYPNRRPFDTHTFNLDDGDRIFMYSDGIQDQFGGEKGQSKFGSRQIREMIVAGNQTKIEHFESKFKTAIREWSKEEPQTDDILMIGVEL